jgi:hypothetical protein
MRKINLILSLVGLLVGQVVAHSAEVSPLLHKRQHTGPNSIEVLMSNPDRPPDHLLRHFTLGQRLLFKFIPEDVKETFAIRGETDLRRLEVVEALAKQTGYHGGKVKTLHTLKYKKAIVQPQSSSTDIPEWRENPETGANTSSLYVPPFKRAGTTHKTVTDVFVRASSGPEIKELASIFSYFLSYFLPQSLKERYQITSSKALNDDETRMVLLESFGDTETDLLLSPLS